MPEKKSKESAKLNKGSQKKSAPSAEKSVSAPSKRQASVSEKSPVSKGKESSSKKSVPVPGKSPCELLNSQCKNTLVDFLGIRFLEVNADEVVAEMTVDERHLQPMGVLHGGAGIAMAESIAGAGSSFLCGKDEMALGIQVSANHIKTAKKGETIFGIGKLIHKGKTNHLWNIGIMTRKNEMLSTIRIVNQIVKKR